MPRVLFVPSSLFPERGEIPVLSRSNVSSQAVNTVEEALMVAKTWKPDLVVFSSHLPPTGAQDFAERIRASDNNPDVRLLLVTEFLTDEEPVAVVDSHLITPVPPAEISQAIAGVLGMRLRGAERIELKLQGKIREFGSDTQEWFEVDIESLSASGLRLAVTSTLLPLESEGIVAFKLPSRPDACVLRSIVRVVYDEMEGRYGVEFQEPPPATRDSIADFVAQELVKAPTE